MALITKPLWTDSQKKDIVERLQQKGVRGACPMCNKPNFTLLEGYFHNSPQAFAGVGLVLGGPTIPTIAIVCTNCGFLSHHAAGALGLLPADPEAR